MREAISPFIPELKSGRFIVFVVRSGVAEAGFEDLVAAVRETLRKADLFVTKESD